jgi:hypothetical protein
MRGERKQVRIFQTAMKALKSRLVAAGANKGLRVTL